MKKVLTIAGSDCSGGAVIQADIKTITAHNMYAMSAITALTAQNTLGVIEIMEATPQIVGEQLDAIFTDIVPNSVKIGMVSNVDIIRVIAEKLATYNAKHLVIDPVMISTSGSRLLSDDAHQVLIQSLLPLGEVITPNIPEATALCGFEISDERTMMRAAQTITARTGVPTLVKGGHLEDDALDILFENGIFHHFTTKRVNNPNTHGTGCTLSSAIACHLANGDSLPESIAHAKNYISGALEAMLDLGAGSGPLNHMYRL